MMKASLIMTMNNDDNILKNNYITNFFRGKNAEN